MVKFMHIPKIPDGENPDDAGPFAPPPAYVRPDHGMMWAKDWELSDEFNKLAGFWLRRRRWLLYNPNWLGRGLGFFQKRNTYIENGSLFLSSREETPDDDFLRANRNRGVGYRKYSTGFVRSKARRTYGYFEISCKMMDSAISSAFWLAHNRNYEIDVFEYSTSEKGQSSGKPFSNLFMMNTHVFKGVNREIDIADPLEIDVGRDLSKERVKVGLLWKRDTITWYLNDVEVRQSKNTSWHHPLHLQFDSEVFKGWFGEPGEYGPNKLPNRFEIYYCRSYMMVPKE